jgi:UDP-2,3-diacylglucosamine pyrophosphatase LpxH
MIRGMAEFDREHREALQRIWVLGDVHARFDHIAKLLLSMVSGGEVPAPHWLVFVGDIDIDHMPFREILEPLMRMSPQTRVAFIHGNHDADSHAHWEMLHDCGHAVLLHGKVVDMDGVRVAGLGGNFQGRIWSPPAAPVFADKDAATKSSRSIRHRGGGQPSPRFNGAIYPSDFDRLAKQRVDILITHEAPSCHPHGFAALDQLARDMRVVRSFHGHHHDDRSDAYALVRESLGFDARGVDLCSIKNGLGELLLGRYVACEVLGG